MRRVAVVAVAVLGVLTLLAGPAAHAAKPKKKPAAPAPELVAPVPPVAKPAPPPTPPPAAKPTEKAAEKAAEKPADKGEVPPAAPKSPADAPVPKPVVRPSAFPEEDVAPPKKARRHATFEGFFLSLNLGTSNHGGVAGPLIPDPTAGTGTVQATWGTFAAWRQAGCLAGTKVCYDRAITTARGNGLAANLQIGYNIKGFVSLWADLAWSGSFGTTADSAGIGTASAMLGLHPLRFWRDDLPVDVKLYSGYGFFESLYYYETEFQTEVKLKGWFGTSVPFGLHTELKIDRDGVFALGADLRFVAGSYTKWVYNNDKDIASRFDANPITTFRFVPRLSLGWHF